MALIEKEQLVVHYFQEFTSIISGSKCVREVIWPDPMHSTMNQVRLQQS
jgi:hypothetical protein